MKQFRLVLVHAVCETLPKTVEAEAAAKAIEAWMDSGDPESEFTLCHHCSKNGDVGDPFKIYAEEVGAPVGETPEFAEEEI